MKLSIFEGLIIAVDFSSNFSYRKKQELKNTIINNCGTISGIITKKCKYLVVTDAEKAKISSKSRIALKFNIPIVSVAFIEACILEGRLVDVQAYEVISNLTTQMLQKGVIQTCGNIDAPKKHSCVVKEWKEDDQDLPYSQYPIQSYDLVHYCIFEGEEKVVSRTTKKPFCVIELHAISIKDKEVSKKASESGVLFKLIVQSGLVDVVEKKCTDKKTTLKFTEDIDAAIQLFNSALKKCQLNSLCNTPTNKLLLFSVASSQLSQELCVAELTAETSELVEGLLKDSRMECQSTLKGPVQALKLFMVERAEVALLEMCQQLKRGTSESMRELLQEFYKNIPHQCEETSVDKKFLVNKLHFCQLLKDMLQVSESTSFEQSPQTTCLYHSLDCHIVLLPQNARIYKSVKSDVNKYKGASILLGDRQVDKSLLQVRGIYKIERLQERNWKFESRAEFQNASKDYHSGDDSGCDDDAGSDDEEEDDNGANGGDGDSVCGDDCATLMFHGTKACNVLGVLSRGLMAGREVVEEMGGVLTDEGNLGNGIYFSKNPVTSLMYSGGSCAGEEEVYNVFVCEVALGKVFETKQLQIGAKEPPPGFDSIKGIPASDSEFKQEEYAVYTRERQRLCYLVQFSLPNNNDNKNNNNNLIITDDVSPNIGDDVVNFYSAAEEERHFRHAEDLLKTNNLFEKEPIKKEVKGGLMTSHGSVPLKSQHVFASVVDLVAKVVIIQEYVNEQDNVANEEGYIEAKFVFPLDEKATVCGFEAFINDKHIVAQVQEKQQAHRIYKEAVSKGHGAYLMDQQEEDDSVFVISVGNLPSKCNALIKITYVTELQTNDEHIDLYIPNNMTPNKKLHLSQLPPRQDTTDSQWTSSASLIDTSIHVSIEMPSLIKAITSPTHVIRTKKTDTIAVVQTANHISLSRGFELQIFLSEVHVPRMWVEKKEDDENDRACMLAFYPEFESSHTSTQHHNIFLIDSSTSMHANHLLQHILRVAHIMISNLPNDAPFNVVLFGSRHVSMHLGTQYKNDNSSSQVMHFLLRNSQPMGSSNLSRVLQKLSYVISSSTDIFFLSDGYLDNLGEVLRQVKSMPQHIRIFTMGLGDPCNTHVLKLISQQARGCFESLPLSHPDVWTDRLKDQLERGRQVGLGEVSIEWQNFNDAKSLHAPRNINVVFSGHRQVVYGFVPDCTSATLRAKVNGREVSIVVSTSELCITTGTLLHTLTAKALIDDWDNGLLLEDSVLDQLIKKSHSKKIIDLSKRHSIVTKLTSFVAVEQRSQGEVFKVTDKKDLLTSTTVDPLPYMNYDPVICKVPLLSTQNDCKEVEVDSDVPSNQFFSHVTDTLDERVVLWMREQMVVERRRREEVVWDLYGELQKGLLCVPTSVDTKLVYVSNDDDLDTDEKIRAFLDKNWYSLECDHKACFSDLKRHYGVWIVDMILEDLKNKYRLIHKEHDGELKCAMDYEMEYGNIVIDSEECAMIHAEEGEFYASTSIDEAMSEEEVIGEEYSSKSDEQMKNNEEEMEERDEVEEDDDCDGMVEGDYEDMFSDWTDVKQRKRSSKLQPMKKLHCFSRANVKKTLVAKKSKPKPMRLPRTVCALNSITQPKPLKAYFSFAPKQRISDDAFQNNLNQKVSAQPMMLVSQPHNLLFSSASQHKEFHSRAEEVKSEQLNIFGFREVYLQPQPCQEPVQLEEAAKSFDEFGGGVEMASRAVGLGAVRFTEKPHLLSSVPIQPPACPLPMSGACLPPIMSSPMNFNDNNNNNNNNNNESSFSESSESFSMNLNINNNNNNIGSCFFDSSENIELNERSTKSTKSFSALPQGMPLSEPLIHLELHQNDIRKMARPPRQVFSQPRTRSIQACFMTSDPPFGTAMTSEMSVSNVSIERNKNKNVRQECASSKQSQKITNDYSMIKRSMLKKAEAILSDMCSLSNECEDKTGLCWELSEHLLATLQNPMNCLMLKQEIIERCLVPCGPDSISEILRMTANLLVVQRFVQIFYKVQEQIDLFNLNDRDAEYDFEGGKEVSLDMLWRLVSVETDRIDTLKILQQLRDKFKDVDQLAMLAAFHYACVVSDKYKKLFKHFSYDVEDYMGSLVLRISQNHCQVYLD